MKKRFISFLLFFILYITTTVSVRASEVTEVQSPVIENISVMTENIEAPGTVEMEFRLSGGEKLEAVNLVFRLRGDADKTLYYWQGQDNLQYYEDDGKNICTFNLAENVVAGKYELAELEVIVQGEQSAKYVQCEAGMKNWDNEHEVPNVEMIVVSGCQDTDFSVPVLVEISADQKIEAGKIFSASVKVTDDSGLKSADFVYYNDNSETYLFLYPLEMSWNAAEESYIFTYKIPNYQEAGTYTLDSVCLTDDSLHANSVSYWRVGSNLVNLDEQIVPASGCRYLTIHYENSENEASILNQDLYWVIERAKLKSTVIYRGGDSEGSLWNLDYNSLQTAKRRELTLILPDMLTDSEIVIHTAKMSGELPAETYAGFLLKELPENVYDIKLQITHGGIPFTVKFKLDSLETLKKYVFQLYEVNNDGIATPVGELLNINEQGYLLLEFPDGMESTEEWKHFQLMKAERPECAGEHEWGEEILLEKATLKKDGQIQVTCKKCGESQTEKFPKVQSITLSSTKYIYDGTVKKPTLTVKDAGNQKLIKGTDYEVKYSATGKNAGRYYVTVTLKGKYSDTVKKYFTIVPKAVTNLNAIRYQYGNQIRLSWTKSAGATGYRIYRRKTTSSNYTYIKSTENNYYVCSNLTQNAAYRFKIIPYYKNNGVQYYSSNAYATEMEYTSVKGKKLVQISNVKASKKGTKVKVSWKNVGYETGYQISRSTSKTGTNIVKTYKTTKGTYTKVSATKGKIYYYKVRAYRTVNGKKIYGAWSEPVKYVRK